MPKKQHVGTPAYNSQKTLNMSLHTNYISCKKTQMISIPVLISWQLSLLFAE